jgi:hypothetical protein
MFIQEWHSCASFANALLSTMSDSTDPVSQIVQGTSDFENWETLTNVIPTNGYFEAMDPNTNSNHRFYRTKIP